MDSEGNVKLADIGILQLREARVQSQVQGRPEDIRWTAPEVLEGYQRSKSSDVYAFGCVALSEWDDGWNGLSNKVNLGQLIVVLKDWLPYPRLQSGVAVAKAVARGEMPVAERQASELHSMWRACLAREGSWRPRATELEFSVSTFIHLCYCKALTTSDSSKVGSW